MNLRELLNEVEMEIVFTALDNYEKKCTGLATRPLQGYGKASEADKQKAWKNKADAIRNVASKLAEIAD